MDINAIIGNYTDEQVIAIVKKMIELLDEAIHGYESSKVREYISRLSAYRGRLVTVEFQMKRLLVDKQEQAIEDGVLTGKTKEIRDIQLESFVKTEKDNYDTIRKLREELTNRSTLACSVLKSVDVNSSRTNNES